MPTKRVPLNRAQHARITPEAVRLWRLICEINAAGRRAQKWEDESQYGRRRERLDAEVALHSELGLSPWHFSPADVPSRGPPQAHEDPARFELAQGLRRALEAAAKP